MTEQTASDTRPDAAPHARVGWIGLGTMGGPMAARLVQAGIEVVGTDLSAEALEKSASQGVRTVGSTAEAVRDVDAVVTILPGPQQVRAVFDGEDGVWANVGTGTLLIDASTVDVETSQWCHDGSAQRGLHFVDAPVSGGVPGAEDGTLTLMLGGADEDRARAAELLDATAGRTIDAGGPTTGIAAKICNNLMLFVNLVSACEGSQLAEHLGLDPKVFWEISTASSGRSFPLETWYPAPGVTPTSPAERGFAPDFPARGAHKDVSLALAAGKLTGVRLPGVELAAQQFQQLMDEGLGDRDCSLIVKYASPDGTVRGFEQD